MKTILYLSVVTELTFFASAAGSAYSSRQATFVPPASPSVTRTANKNAEALSFARSQMISGGYGLYPTITTSNTAAAAPSSTQLFAKKKKKTAPAASTKVQVKLLKHIPGTGQIGEVVMVTPAFFNNKLLPNQAAKKVSDEEVAKETSEKQMKESAERAKANELKEKLDELKLNLTRKAGPDGHLFGGIGPKLIMGELESKIADDFFKNKWVKVAEVLNEDGKKIKGDIKETGAFEARINLLTGISAKVGITVEAE